MECSFIYLEVLPPLAVFTSLLMSVLMWTWSANGPYHVTVHVTKFRYLDFFTTIRFLDNKILTTISFVATI